jgi:hypothetical protein
VFSDQRFCSIGVIERLNIVAISGPSFQLRDNDILSRRKEVTESIGKDKNLVRTPKMMAFAIGT